MKVGISELLRGRPHGHDRAGFLLDGFGFARRVGQHGVCWGAMVTLFGFVLIGVVPSQEGS
ncbi:hypothetical protein [Microvirga massiliensis]|uniref:hypothetical protein n=1 Tax=Microvirga massiliensis TaxID=1033741 RepID=UPI00062BC79B|nr:hypothetical protein [Microvirga massiliensis]